MNEEQPFENDIDLEDANNPFSAASSKGRRNKASLRQKTTEHYLHLYQCLLEENVPPTLETRIRNLLSYFKENKADIYISVIRKILKIHLPYFCFLKQLTDSDVVIEVLQCIHEIRDGFDGNLARFLLTALCSRNNHSEDAIRERKECGLSSYSYIEYFLHHCKIKKITFDGCRITDMFWKINLDHLIINVLYANPESLLKVLQYGVRFFGQADNPSELFNPLLARAIEYIIYRGMRDGAWDSELLSLRVQFVDLPSHIKRMCHNFMIVMRSVPNPHVVTCRIAGTAVENARIPIPKIGKLRPFYEIVFPDQEFGIPRPVSLKHACKCVIRRTLNDYWQLPDGIWKLRLPTLLCNYLNLQE